MTSNSILSSSGKYCGSVYLKNNKIIIHNNSKPQDVIIDNLEIINLFNSKCIDTTIFIRLWDDYNLLISEIAAIFGLTYYIVWKYLKNSDKKTGTKFGRRNSSYGKKFSQERIDSAANWIRSGLYKVYYNEDLDVERWFIKDTQPDGYIEGRKPFTDAWKNNISKAVIEGQVNGTMLTMSEISKIGWARGAYDDVDFGHGIGGHMTSTKTNKRFFFRSLLELYYIIYYLEEDDSVLSYIYEPFRIVYDNNRTYTPDILVNNTVIEIKSYKFIYSQGGDIQEKFESKALAAAKYCLDNGLNYKVIFDKDIGYNQNTFIRDLYKNNYINKFDIEFSNPDRVLSKLK